MSEQDVLHDFAVAQNRGGAFARFLRLIRFSHTDFCSALRARRPGRVSQRPAQSQDRAAGPGVYDYGPHGGNAFQSLR